MRTVLTLFFTLPFLAHAQTLVSTAPQQRTALLEEFTAAGCGNCPAAHAVANSLANPYGEDLTIIGIHGGSLAAPQTGQPDFRTPDGSALWSQFAVAFQPQGMVNRQGLQQAGSWSSSVVAVLSGLSPVNIGVSSTYDPGAGSITVMVELFYTGEVPSGEGRIHVALTQDGIVARQADYVNGTQQNYMHRHVLRDLITPLAGDPFDYGVEGVFVQRTYTLPIDMGWTLADLDVVAFVSEVSGVVHQVRSVAADGGITTSVEDVERSIELGNAFPQPASELVRFTVGENAVGQVLQLRDGLGRLVRDQRVAGSVVQFSVADLGPGIYFASLPGMVAQKIVVAH